MALATWAHVVADETAILAYLEIRLLGKKLRRLWSLEHLKEHLKKFTLSKKEVYQDSFAFESLTGLTMYCD